MPRCPMRHFFVLLTLLPTLAQAWGNHSPMCYRAFERMPEVAGAAPVKAEPLTDFLRDQEAAIAASEVHLERTLPAVRKKIPLREPA